MEGVYSHTEDIPEDVNNRYVCRYTCGHITTIYIRTNCL